jgi:hypothetical protein
MGDEGSDEWETRKLLGRNVELRSVCASVHISAPQNVATPECGERTKASHLRSGAVRDEGRVRTYVVDKRKRKNIGNDDLASWRPAVHLRHCPTVNPSTRPSQLAHHKESGIRSECYIDAALMIVPISTP